MQAGWVINVTRQSAMQITLRGCWPVVGHQPIVCGPLLFSLPTSLDKTHKKCRRCFCWHRPLRNPTATTAVPVSVALCLLYLYAYADWDDVCSRGSWWQQGPCPALLCSGGRGEDGGDEPPRYRRWFLGHGTPGCRCGFLVWNFLPHRWVRSCLVLFSPVKCIASLCLTHGLSATNFT